MAALRKRGNTWRAEVFKNGIRQSATFPTKAMAQDWATKLEADIAAGVRGWIPDKTVGDLLERYGREVSVKKRGARWESVRISQLRRDTLATVRLKDLSEADIARWRDRRLNGVSAASVRREWNLLSHAFTVATKEWKWLNGNPARNVRRPDPPKPRSRLIADDEIERLLYALGSDMSTVTGRVGAAFRFALETAMRAGEICGLRWQDVHGRVAHLPMTKNGSERHVPLSTAAVSIIESMPKAGDLVFGLNVGQLDALFRKAKGRALLDGFTFHDARATALTRMAKKLTPFELAKVSGHRDLRLLLNVYYREDPATIADKLG